MFEKGTESWSIATSSDMSLNFAIFTGCIYGLVENADETSGNILWPPKLWINKSNKSLPLLKEEWNQWFGSMINYKGKRVILKQGFDLTNMFNPPDFSDFPYCKLQECCKNAWQPFIEWWQMSGGGKNALSFFEGLDNKRIYDYIDEFENIVQRKVKPFNLYIDLVYTGIPQTIEVNSEYIVMVPVRPIYIDKDWWINKLKQIG